MISGDPDELLPSSAVVLIVEWRTDFANFTGFFDKSELD